MTQQRFLNRDPNPEIPFTEDTHRKADSWVLAVCLVAGLLLIHIIWDF